MLKPANHVIPEKALKLFKVLSPMVSTRFGAIVKVNDRLQTGSSRPPQQPFWGCYFILSMGSPHLQPSSQSASQPASAKPRRWQQVRTLEIYYLPRKELPNRSALRGLSPDIPEENTGYRRCKCEKGLESGGSLLK